MQEALLIFNQIAIDIVGSEMIMKRTTVLCAWPRRDTSPVQTSKLFVVATVNILFIHMQSRDLPYHELSLVGLRRRHCQI